MTGTGLDQYRRLMEMAKPFKPAFIVLNAPGHKAGPQAGRRRCMGCQTFFSISIKSKTMINDVRRQKGMIVVVCHACLTVMQLNNPALASRPHSTVDQARQLYGLE